MLLTGSTRQRRKNWACFLFFDIAMRSEEQQSEKKQHMINGYNIFLLKRQPNREERTKKSDAKNGQKQSSSGSGKGTRGELNDNNNNNETNADISAISCTVITKEQTKTL